MLKEAHNWRKFRFDKNNKWVVKSHKPNVVSLQHELTTHCDDLETANVIIDISENLEQSNND